MKESKNNDNFFWVISYETFFLGSGNYEFSIAFIDIFMKIQKKTSEWEIKLEKLNKQTQKILRNLRK